eukprot:10232164-Prorocentrum_lima.AAC.1
MGDPSITLDQGVRLPRRCAWPRRPPTEGENPPQTLCPALVPRPGGSGDLPLARGGGGGGRRGRGGGGGGVM